MPTKWFLVIFAVILCGPVSAQEPQSWTGHDKLALTHYFYWYDAHTGPLECQKCHPIPGDGDFATIPATSTCMACHKTVKKDSPEIAKLAAANAKGEPIEWVRVYKIPDYVSFNHRKHVAAEGVTCETCHGPVKEREVMRREKDISMAACMECHRAKNASVNCTFCHDEK